MEERRNMYRVIMKNSKPRITRQHVAYKREEIVPRYTKSWKKWKVEERADRRNKERKLKESETE